MTDPFVCPEDHRHGESTTCYKHGCRCADCRAAHRDYQYWRANMHRRGRLDLIDSVVDARGVHRRLQALATLGWSFKDVADRLGIQKAAVRHYLNRDRVLFSVHGRVERVYDELADTLPPANTKGQRISVSRTIARAKRNGWARPIDWDDIDLDEAPPVGEEVLVDELAVQLAVAGHQVKLSTQERHLAVIELNGRRYNDQEIAEMLRVDARTILRDRKLLDLPAHPEPYEERFAA